MTLDVTVSTLSGRAPSLLGSTSTSIWLHSLKFQKIYTKKLIVSTMKTITLQNKIYLYY